MLYVKGAIVDY